MDFLQNLFQNPETRELFDAVIREVDDRAIDSLEWTKWLQTPPCHSVARVNTLKTTREKLKEKVEEHLKKQYKSSPVPEVSDHHDLPDVLVIRSAGAAKALDPPGGSAGEDPVEEVIVDLMCGLAVLRGANVFAPGILGCPSSVQVGAAVSVFADVDGLCLKGRTASFTEGRKYFLGRGVARMSRDQLFRGQAPPRGVAVEMTERVFDCPSLSESDFGGELFLQNLPSVLVGHILAPQPGETILDMCAAPGGKTTHIATLMRDEGRVVAFDKSRNKIDQIERNAEQMGITCISAFVQDGTKSVSAAADPSSPTPPFAPAAFDRVLLDAPCSALGQRPQLKQNMKPKELQSFPKLQKKLVEAAYTLLRPGGTLVYSTCTYPQDENEEIVSWARAKFPRLILQDLSQFQKGKGSSRGMQEVLRFGHPVLNPEELGPNNDTIGFFIAKFQKGS